MIRLLLRQRVKRWVKVMGSGVYCLMGRRGRDGSASMAFMLLGRGVLL